MHRLNFFQRRLKPLRQLLRRLRFPGSRQRYAILGCCLCIGLILTQGYANIIPAAALYSLPLVQEENPETLLTQRPTTPNPNINQQREFRGVWVASVANIDWPSKPGLTVPQQKAELIQILDRMQQLNLNAMILQVRPAGDTFYASSLEPWSYWLTGTQGKPPSPLYDPLEFAIQESHKRNIELHAWFNPYRAQNASNYALAANHMARKYPQYAYEYGDLFWMDPGAKEVQDQTYNAILDVVRRYDVDGIHLDDYFYPYPVSGVEFPDARTYAAYKQAGGTLSKGDWRRDNVNKMIKRLWEGIKAAKPHVKFGISPFGIYRPGNPPGIVGLDQYADIYADVKLWLAQGWLDYLSPQLYWRIDPPNQSYPALLKWWLSVNPKRRHIYTGNIVSRLGDWPVSEIERQVQISRSLTSQLSLGNIFFSMKVFKENRSGVNERFKTVLYPTPALTPVMPWLDATPPNPPTGLQTTPRKLSWNPANSNDIRSWSLYQEKGNRWEMVKVLNAATTSTTVTPGKYALRAVDRSANESESVIALVQ